MSKKFNQETIDQYLNQQLKDEALRDFESKMNSDAELKKEVELQALLHRGINKFAEDDMRSALKRMRTEVLTEESGATGSAKVVSLGQKKKSSSVFKWGIAAAIVMAIGLALFLFDNDPTASSSDLYASYYSPFSEEINARNSTVASTVIQASQLYKEANYEAALPLFLQSLSAEPNNAELQLATGICQLELQRYEKAIQTFKAVDNPLFIDQAQWYLAMTLLKKNDVGQVKKVLENIKNGDFKYEEAQEILGKM